MQMGQSRPAIRVSGCDTVLPCCVVTGSIVVQCSTSGLVMTVPGLAAALLSAAIPKLSIRTKPARRR